MFCIYVIKNTAGANSSAINKYATTTKFIYDAYRKKTTTGLCAAWSLGLENGLEVHRASETRGPEAALSRLLEDVTKKSLHAAQG